MAGFHVTGVDHKAQPRYAGDVFVLGDALEYCRAHGHEFDAIHASPPCQRYTVANNIHRKDHPDLLPGTRDELIRVGKPWVIENVPGAPMPGAIVVCGLALGCNVKRHRLFESSLLLFGTGCPRSHPGDWLLVFGHTVLERGHTVGVAKGGGPVIRRRHTTTARGREAMGIDWMNRNELSEAIPPAYTFFIGTQLMQAVMSGSRSRETTP